MKSDTTIDGLQQQLRRREQIIAELEQALHRERSHRQLLHDINQAPDVPSLLLLLGRQLQQLGLFDGYLITVHDASSRELVCVDLHLPESHAGMRDILKNYRFSLDDPTPLANAFLRRSTQLLHLEDLDPDDLRVRQGFAWWQATSLATVPIPHEDGVIGVINGFRQQGRVKEHDVTALEEQLRPFSRPLRRALLLAEFQQGRATVEAALDEHQRFLRFITEINALSSPQRIYEATLQQLLTAHHFDAGLLSLAEPDVGLVTKHVSVRESIQSELRERLLDLLKQTAPFDVTVSARAYAYLQNTHLFIPDVNDVRDLPMLPADREIVDTFPEIRTILHMPIRQHGNAIGMLGLTTIGQPRSLRPEELSFIELLASFIGTVITNAQLYQVVDEQKARIETLNQALQARVQQLDESIRRDPLTGLHNFGAFREELTRRVHEANRHADTTDLCVIIIDIDHFKRLNDTHGHITGNVVLQELATRITRVSRAADIACRFGGEEFTVILPHTTLIDARTVAQRLRAEVAQHPFRVGDLELSLTVSLGCAHYQPGESIEEFLNRADQALYHAKGNGRNRVESLPTLVM